MWEISQKRAEPAGLGEAEQAKANKMLQGKEGVLIVKTTQAILVAHYPEHVQPGQATNVVEQLGDYLVSVGY
jgi:hypothetical protein